MTSFYIVNSLVIVLGVCCAAVGWRLPLFALLFPAVMLVNATGFHVLPVIRTRVFSPGLVTAVVLFYPIAIWCFVAAAQDDVLSIGTTIASLVLGVLLMAYPIILLKIRHWRCFRYGVAETATD